ncbi:uncharacterized protein [Panulirus ornatus]|uniref:uncharacterized protein n=1 Tax=Panulirus ornatus TaxID=150431 RepID=UPI003A8789A0
MMGILQERLGPLLCCPPRQDHPHQHQDPPESTSVMSRVPRESSATEEDLPLEVLDRTNHTPDLQAVTDHPPLTSSHHHNHTLQDCRDAPHCVPGSSHDQTDGEGQSSEADEVPDQAAGWSLPSTGQLKSFSCDDIHPLYHFPDQKGHQRLSFTGSQGHQSAKPSNTEPQNIEEMVESISVGGRSPDSCSRVDACVSFLRDDEGSFSSPGGIQDFQPNMIPLLVTMRVTTVVSPSELITDISPFTKFLESPSSDAVSEQSEADTSPSAEPGGSNVSPEEFQSDDRLSPAEELQARSTTSTRVFTPPAVSLSYNLSQTSTLEENCEATVNASTEDLVSTVTTTTNDFPRSVPETGQQTVVRTPSTNDVSPMPSTPTVHVASTASSPAATPTQESSPSSSDTPTSTKREALPPSEAPAVGPLTRPARPTVRR